MLFNGFVNVGFFLVVMGIEFDYSVGRRLISRSWGWSGLGYRDVQSSKALIQQEVGMKDNWNIFVMKSYLKDLGWGRLITCFQQLLWCRIVPSNVGTWIWRFNHENNAFLLGGRIISECWHIENLVICRKVKGLAWKWAQRVGVWGQDWLEYCFMMRIEMQRYLKALRQESLEGLKEPGMKEG